MQKSNNLKHYFDKFSNIHKFINVRKHNKAKLKIDIFNKSIVFFKDYDFPDCNKDEFSINNYEFEFMKTSDDDCANCYVQQHLIFDNIEIELFMKLEINGKEIVKHDLDYDLYYNGNFYNIEQNGILSDKFPLKELPNNIFDWKEEDIFYFNLKKG